MQSRTNQVLSSEKQAIIDGLADKVKAKMLGEGSGHDWWHIYRVWQNAIEIGNTEDVDMYVVQAAALLHDIDDWKFNGGDMRAGGRAAGQWMSEFNADKKTIDHVSAIIDGLSFKGAGVDTTLPTMEGKVVQDADRLESMGAMGVARTFAYGGYKGRPIYDPDIKPENHATLEQYKNSKGPTINHFYEKLLLLNDRMNTDYARKLAGGRHEFMESFLRQFFAEWSGNA